jgi:hypothetical protein
MAPTVARWVEDRPYCGRCRSDKPFGRWSGFYNGLLTSTYWHERDGRWVRLRRSGRKPESGYPAYQPMVLPDGRKLIQIGLPGRIICPACGAENQVAPP